MKTSSFKKTYDGRTVLDVPALTLTAGKVYAVIGSNGSGKSTFAKILAGVLKSDDRKKLFPAQNILSADTPDAADEDSVPSISVGYMPQKNYGFRMSTLKNILLGNPDKEKAVSLMKKLQISHLADKRADRLSGGETARMALARLMMKQFDLVILDEPTAAMDMETTFLSEKLILNYVQQTGCILILVTHSLQQAKRMADEIFYFHKGQLFESGPAQEILSHPSRPETKQFLDFYGL